MTTQPETVEIETGDAPKACVVWLHGLGADGHDFVPVVPELDLPCDTRFVFPHAPVRAVSINRGARMRAWYDILSMDRTDLEDEAGIRASAAGIAVLIDREIDRGIPAERIVVAGFSQGGAIALQSALRYPERLAGVMALSTYLPLSWTLADERHPANAASSIFMAHGVDDRTLPEAMGQSSRRQLEALGYTVEWHSYPMAHSVCVAEIHDISAWLSRVLS